MTALTLRAMAEADIPMVSWLEGTALEQARTASVWQRELVQPAYGAWVAARADGRVIGFIAYSLAAGELSINHLAVAPECRRQRVAESLVYHLLHQGEGQGAREVFLDVRRGNRAARGLYHKLGFIQVGERRGYYRSPPDDALTLHRLLSGA